MKQITIYDKDVKDFANACKYQKATMDGVYKDLEKLREDLVELYDKRIFWLDYFKADAPYMGWDPNSPEYQNMVNLTKDIRTMFLKAYVLTEKGLGNDILFKEEE